MNSSHFSQQTPMYYGFIDAHIIAQDILKKKRREKEAFRTGIPLFFCHSYIFMVNLYDRKAWKENIWTSTK